MEKQAGKGVLTFREKMIYTSMYCASFVGIGLGYGLSGPAIPLLEKRFHISTSTVGTFFLSQAIGSVLGSIGTGFLFQKLVEMQASRDARSTYSGMLGITQIHAFYVASIIIFTISSTGIGWIPMFWLIYVAFAVRAWSGNAIDLFANGLLLQALKTDSGPYLQGLHFSFGVGALLPPFIFAAVTNFLERQSEDHEADPSQALTVSCLILVILYIPIALPFLFIRSPKIELEKSEVVEEHMYPDQLHEVNVIDNEKSVEMELIEPAKNVESGVEGGETPPQEMSESSNNDSSTALADENREELNNEDLRDDKQDQNEEESNMVEVELEDLPQAVIQHEYAEPSQNKARIQIIGSVVMASYLLVIVGLEIAVGSWIAEFALKMNWMTSLVLADYLTFSFWVCFTGGRLVGIAISVFYSPTVMLLADQLVCTFTSIILLLAVIFEDYISHTAKQVILWSSAIGLGSGIASIYASMVSLPTAVGWETSGQLYALIIIGGAIGENVGPWILGTLMQHGARWYPVTVFVCCLGSIVLYVILWLLSGLSLSDWFKKR